MENLDPNEITLFAKTNFRNKEVPFGIKLDDRRRHMYIIGKTGMGKSNLIENMVIQDIINDKGVALVDPHGDLVEKVLDFVPSRRVNDVVYINPADMEYPIAFNILESVDPRYKHLVASGLMGVFTKIWANLWSARMEYILNNAILALLDSPGNTLLGISRMLIDKKFRKRIVDNIKDPMVRAFWTDEFANWQEKYRQEAIAPILNKVGQFLSSGVVRNIVGQPKSTIDLRQMMDEKKILLLNLSKGRVGEDNSKLLGAMIITKLQLAALSRVDIPEPERSDFFLYVDEFQNFATESFATILSEARKYRLNLIIAHQYVGQLVEDRNTKVRDAVFGNVGTIVTFRVGAADAEFLEKEFEPTFMQTDLVNLPKYTIILRLMINGVASDPFTAVTLPPGTYERTGNSDKVIRVSRERYANHISSVEDKISRWMGQEYHEGAAQAAGGARMEHYDDDEAETQAADAEELSEAQAERAQRGIDGRANAEQSQPAESPAEIRQAEIVVPNLTSMNVERMVVGDEDEPAQVAVPDEQREEQADELSERLRRQEARMAMAQELSQPSEQESAQPREPELTRQKQQQLQETAQSAAQPEEPRREQHSESRSKKQPAKKDNNPIWNQVEKLTEQKIQSELAKEKSLVDELAKTLRTPIEDDPRPKREPYNPQQRGGQGSGRGGGQGQNQPQGQEHSHSQGKGKQHRGGQHRSEQNRNERHREQTQRGGQVEQPHRNDEQRRREHQPMHGQQQMHGQRSQHEYRHNESVDNARPHHVHSDGTNPQHPHSGRISMKPGQAIKLNGN